MLFKQNVHRTSLALVIIPEIRFTGMHGPPQFSSVPAKVCIQAPVPVPDSDISLLSFLRKQESINPTLPELKSPKCDSQPCIAHRLPTHTGESRYPLHLLHPMSMVGQASLPVQYQYMSTLSFLRKQES